MNQNRLKYLFSKYGSNSLSKNELKELLELVDSMDEEMLHALIDDLLDHDLISQLKSELRKADVYRKIHLEVGLGKEKKVKLFSTKWAVVAALFLGILVVGLLWTNWTKEEVKPKMVSADIHLPDGNHAQVSFEDGTTLSLLDVSDKVLQEKGIKLIRSDDGELLFKIEPIDQPIDQQHVFYSAKGTSSQLMLSDGTKVLLNSGASLTYPTCFAKGSRRVKVDGEAYFEVTHDTNRPFIVSTNASEIKVLGTEFNVATDIKEGQTLTTLVEGAVEINNRSRRALLKPGMQSISNNMVDEIKTYPVDIRQVLAWKEGYFRFKNDDIKSVLEKMKKWYAIEGYDILVSKPVLFTGSVRRTRKLSDLLKQLEKTSSYKFNIVEGRVQVMN